MVSGWYIMMLWALESSNFGRQVSGYSLAIIRLLPIACRFAWRFFTDSSWKRALIRPVFRVPNSVCDLDFEYTRGSKQKTGKISDFDLPPAPSSKGRSAINLKTHPKAELSCNLKSFLSHTINRVFNFGVLLLRSVDFDHFWVLCRGGFSTFVDGGVLVLGGGGAF